MDWKFQDDKPIYLQIKAQIKEMIAVGELKPNTKLASVRDMAIEAGVNPNTMQKALSELESEGLLYSQRTAGRFVADNENINCNLQKNLKEKYMEKFENDMRKLGFTAEESLEEYKKYVGGRK